MAVDLKRHPRRHRGRAGSLHGGADRNPDGALTGNLQCHVDAGPHRLSTIRLGIGILLGCFAGAVIATGLLIALLVLAFRVLP